MVIVPARGAGDPGSNPGPGENFFPLKLTTQDLPDGYYENQIFIHNLPLYAIII